MGKKQIKHRNQAGGNTEKAEKQIVGRKKQTKQRKPIEKSKKKTDQGVEKAEKAEKGYRVVKILVNANGRVERVEKHKKQIGG